MVARMLERKAEGEALLCLTVNDDELSEGDWEKTDGGEASFRAKKRPEKEPRGKGVGRGHSHRNNEKRPVQWPTSPLPKKKKTECHRSPLSPPPVATTKEGSSTLPPPSCPTQQPPRPHYSTENRRPDGEFRSPPRHHLQYCYPSSRRTWMRRRVLKTVGEVCYLCLNRRGYTLVLGNTIIINRGGNHLKNLVADLNASEYLRFIYLVGRDSTDTYSSLKNNISKSLEETHFSIPRGPSESYCFYCNSNSCTTWNVYVHGVRPATGFPVTVVPH